MLNDILVKGNSDLLLEIMGQCEFIHEKITSHGFQREIAQQIFLQIVENAGQQFTAASPVYVDVLLTQSLIVFHHQMQNAIYGTAFAVLLLAALVRRSYPRLETFLSSFFLGLSTDFWRTVLAHVQGSSLLVSVPLLVLGMVVISFAVACYMISVFPTNPTDDFVVALHERGVRIGTAKIGLDGVCVLLALILGGEIGVGTILCTFGLGPIIDVFHRVISKLVQNEKHP